MVPSFCDQIAYVISCYFMFFRISSCYFVHVIPCYFMLFRDISCYFVHVSSCDFMLFHVISSYFMVFRVISCYFVFFHCFVTNAVPFRFQEELTVRIEPQKRDLQF